MKGSNCLFSYFILILVFTSTNSASSQATASRFWFSGGLGMCTLGSIAGSANASVQFKRTLFSLRGTVNSESLFDDQFSDIGLLVGLATQGSKGHASAAIGVAMVAGSKSKGLFSGREDIDPTFGVPIEVQLFRDISRVVSIGLYAYANLNEEQNFGGITLNLRLGRLR